MTTVGMTAVGLLRVELNWAIGRIATFGTVVQEEGGGAGFEGFVSDLMGFLQGLGLCDMCSVWSVAPCIMGPTM